MWMLFNSHLGLYKDNMLLPLFVLPSVGETPFRIFSRLSLPTKPKNHLNTLITVIERVKKEL